ncbi:pentatricopeptide repeat-containing protein At2g35030, mitochondrial-like [Salvia hispanica]|uniref:pentatricopeptide repeat-containing protein At2g35030, mitochondrial-like n=1 Tax=Salvia hispanica TaxID=49212 RepID=UPI002009911E|nr:pentatricopeptide repeat-containing protein At2g35030, mitochondrial-like [Salvia hispanica]
MGWAGAWRLDEKSFIMYRQISTLNIFLRSSTNLWHVPLSSVCSNFYAQKFHLLRLYHSMTEAEKQSKLSIPRRDYSLKQDVARANCMITCLCEEGKIREARQLFEVMPERDVISWTALISGYMKCGLVGEARELFDRVDAEKNGVTWTAMISGYLKMKRVAEAEKLFYKMPDKNVVAWNTMIEGYVRSGEIDQALLLFEGMGERNILSWNMVISGLVSCGRVEEARGIFDRMSVRNVISWNIMISGLSRYGKVGEARLLFDRMPERSVVSWNAMITGLMQNGELEKGRRLFDEMPGKNVVSWTAVISGYTQHGRSEEALRMFYEMNRSLRVRPNEGTFASVLGACSDFAGLVEGLQLHQVISKTVYQESQFVISSLINMYSKCGVVAMARKVFDHGLRHCRDLVCCNSMISAYAHHGCGRDAIMVFEEMRRRGFKPNEVTYVGLLSACSYAGLVQEGLDYFEMLTRNKSIKVREEHYTCIVDLYGRAGRVKEAFELMKKLGGRASVNSWCTLLLGCKIHGNEEIGKQVAEKLLDVETEGNAGTYSLVSSLYAARGRTTKAEMVKLRMKQEGLKKQPGCSWIDAGNKFHVFAAGDRCNEFLIFDLHEKMKNIGDGDMLLGSE